MRTNLPCQCNLPEEMKAAGGAALLCHHSPPDRVRETQEQLLTLLNDMGQEIDIQDMFTIPLRELAEKYMRGLLGADYGLRNQKEHNIMMAAFFRHISIGVQAMMAGLILDISEENGA